jgi:hypothetical protein
VFPPAPPTADQPWLPHRLHWCCLSWVLRRRHESILQVSHLTCRNTQGGNGTNNLLPPSFPSRRRDSKWANSALVVTVQPSDWQHLVPQHGLLAGMALQEGYEREAARRGGAAFVAPAQRASDFLAGRPSSGQLPPSSYRLGVKATSLHDFYPPHMTAAFVAALQRFNRQMPGFAGYAHLLQMLLP